MSEFSEKIQRQREQAKQSGPYKVADFEGGKTVTHEIAYLVQNQMVFEKERDVLYFEGSNRQLVLNLTNAEWLIANLGDDPEQWAGHLVTLYLHPYGRQNKMGIRLRAAEAEAPTGNGPAQRALVSRASEPGRAVPFDDEVPFTPEWR